MFNVNGVREIVEIYLDVDIVWLLELLELNE